MKNLVKQSQVPESEELRKKRKELSLLEEELSHRKAYLNQLEIELEAFETKHSQEIFNKFAELDRINEEIICTKELLSNSAFSDSDISAASKNFEKRFTPEAFLNEENADKYEVDARINASKPSKNLKLIYRKVAKLIHPDFSLDNEDQRCRENLMARANLAYELNDENALLILLNLFQDESISEQIEVSSELTFIIRNISRVKIQLIDINERIKKLEESETFELKSKIERAVAKGLNLIIDMVLQLDRQIKSARNELQELKEKLTEQKVKEH